MLRFWAMICLAIFVAVIGFAVLPLNLSAAEPAGGLPRRCVLDQVPQYFQGKNECGPTALRMVLAFYGAKIPKKKIVEEVHTSPSRGTSPKELMRYPESLGFKVADKFSGTIDDIARSIAGGRPVIVNQWKTADAKLSQVMSHYRVVIGYDFDNQMIYLRDPSKSGLASASFREFMDLWDMNRMRGIQSKNWMLIISK